MNGSEAKEKDALDNVIYKYTAQTNQLELENALLKETVGKLREELDRFKKPPLMVAEIRSVSGKNATISIPNGNQFFVEISEGSEKLRAGDMVLAEQKNLCIIKKIPLAKKFNVERFVIIEKPATSWQEIGGLTSQVREIQEVVELPLKKPELFRKVGINPPKGVLLHGPPGTGKTLLAKAVAHSTNATFIEVVGSELVQKFIGEGAKLVNEIFEMARKKAPSIVFIDEIDALASKRMEMGTSGEREVNRTFMQLLAELDGFEPLGNVKVIGATNRKDMLDPAVIRPGRLDRMIEVPVPDGDGRKQIFKIHSQRMNLAGNVNVDALAKKMDGFSGAEIHAVCTEAGYFAIRDNRVNITKEDLLDAIKKVKQEEKLADKEFKGMFG